MVSLLLHNHLFMYIYLLFYLLLWTNHPDGVTTTGAPSRQVNAVLLSLSLSHHPQPQTSPILALPCIPRHRPQSTSICYDWTQVFSKEKEGGGSTSSGPHAKFRVGRSALHQQHTQEMVSDSKQPPIPDGDPVCQPHSCGKCPKVQQGTM